MFGQDHRSLSRRSVVQCTASLQASNQDRSKSFLGTAQHHHSKKATTFRSQSFAGRDHILRGHQFPQAVRFQQVPAQVREHRQLRRATGSIPQTQGVAFTCGFIRI